jgi:hypothetical protein
VRFRALRDILDSFDKSKIVKDPRKLARAFGRVEAVKAFMAIRENRDAFEDLATAARDSDAVQADAAKRRESDAFRIQRALNDVKLSIARAFTPERIEKVAKALELMARGIEILVDNLPTVAAILAGLKLSPALNQLIGAGGLGGVLGGGGAAGGGRAGGGRGGGAFGGLGLGPGFIIGESTVKEDIKEAVIGAFEFRAQFAEKIGEIFGVTAELEREIERARREAGLFGGEQPRTGEPVPAAGGRQTVDVNVSVDHRGMLRAEETEESRQRRSTVR